MHTMTPSERKQKSLRTASYLENSERINDPLRIKWSFFKFKVTNLYIERLRDT